MSIALGDSSQFSLVQLARLHSGDANPVSQSMESYKFSPFKFTRKRYIFI